MPVEFVTFTAALIDESGQLYGAIGWTAPPAMPPPGYVHLPANFVQGDPTTMPVIDDKDEPDDLNATTFARTIVFPVSATRTELMYQRLA